jgi:hypothetical protein
LVVVDSIQRHVPSRWRMRATCVRVSNGRLPLVNVVGMHARHRRLADELARGKPEDPLARRADVLDGVVGAVDGDRLGGVLDEQLEPALGLGDEHQPAGLAVEHPHRLRVLLEQQPIGVRVDVHRWRPIISTH